MSSVSDLFSLENQVGPYEGPRLGYAAEGGPDDFVYSPGYAGLLRDRNRNRNGNREGGVLQLGGSRPERTRVTKKRQGRKGQKGQKNKKHSTRRCVN